MSADTNNRHGNGWSMTISRFVHSNNTYMATTGRLVANCFVLFGPRRWFCPSYKSLKFVPFQQLRYPQFTVLHFQIFRGQVPRSPSF